MQFLQCQLIDHTTSSSHFPWSNGFIEWQVKTLNATLSTTQDAGRSIKDLLLYLWSTPISPQMPSSREILHNRTIQCLGKPSTPVDMEEVCNHLIAMKKSQKQYFDRAHNAKAMAQLDLSQEILFLYPTDQSTYIHRTIVDKASTP